jgi:hypothetical protein
MSLEKAAEIAVIITVLLILFQIGLTIYFEQRNRAE